MERLATFLLIVSSVLAAALVVGTANALPDHVAIHFGWSGHGNNIVSRSQYVTGGALVALLAPLFLAGSMIFTVHRASWALNLPHRAYWYTPERRPATLAWLTLAAAWLGVALAVFLAGMHAILLEANALQPPQLPTPYFLAWLALFIAAVLAWTLAFFVRFGRAPVATV